MRRKQKEKIMKKLMMEESGQGMVEYIIIVMLIALVAIVGVTALGNRTKAAFSDAAGAF